MSVALLGVTVEPVGWGQERFGGVLPALATLGRGFAAAAFDVGYELPHGCRVSIEIVDVSPNGGEG